MTELYLHMFKGLPIKANWDSFSKNMEVWKYLYGILVHILEGWQMACYFDLEREEKTLMTNE